MFDAKSLLEALTKGAAPAQSSQAAPGGMGSLGDLLGQIMGGAQQPGAAAAPQAAPGGMGGLGDLLGKIMQGGAAPQAGAPAGGQAGGQAGGIGGLDEMLRKLMPAPGAPGAQAAQPGQATPAGGSTGGGLGDILGKLGAGGQGGGLADILGQILGQATSGVKEGAQRIDSATGIGKSTRDAVTQTTGQTPDELLAKLKELIAQNQTGAAAAAGGLGAVVLGTKAGRAAALGAAKLGALALIGGLAYKAYQNYAQGRPMVSAASGFIPEQAPSGSGFEPQAISNDDAILYIRAMIAAAAADGRIDASEQQRILGSLKQAGLESAAHNFLQGEINSPATTDDLAAACKTPAQAVQVFTAARIAIDLDSDEENDFLVDLANKLGIDEKLARHIDAAAAAQQAA